jgi:hypothetical protein
MYTPTKPPFLSTLLSDLLLKPQDASPLSDIFHKFKCSLLKTILRRWDMSKGHPVGIRCKNLPEGKKQAVLLLLILFLHIHLKCQNSKQEILLKPIAACTFPRLMEMPCHSGFTCTDLSLGNASMGPHLQPSILAAQL